MLISDNSAPVSVRYPVASIMIADATPSPFRCGAAEMLSEEEKKEGKRGSRGVVGSVELRRRWKLCGKGGGFWAS